MQRSRFVILPLLSKYRISSNGNPFAPATNNYIDINVPRLNEVLPYAQELTLFTGGEDQTTNLRWGIFLYSAFTRSFETGDPVQIGQTVGGTTKATLRHTPYSTLASFNLESRLLIGVGNSAGTLAETGIVSAALGVLMYES